MMEDDEKNNPWAATTIRPFTSQVVHVNEPTLRDQFAMAALTGICANQAINPTKIDRNVSGFARSIYDLADAMMNARNAA